MNQRSLGDMLAETVNIALLLIISCTMIVPFLYIFSVSFSSVTDVLQNDVLLWPKEWVLDAYKYILDSSRFTRSLYVSAGITVIGTAMNLLFTVTMAYALSRSFRGQKTVLFLVLLSFLFSAGMIPTYLIVKATGLLDTVWAVIIPALISPWNLIVIREFFKSIPHELHEAALMDGANDLRIFWSVILPLSKPALATFALFYAVAHWNAYFSAIIYLNNSSLWPVQVVLRQIVVVNDSSTLMGGQMAESPPPAETIQMAAIWIATLPILVVYPFLQKHFAKGVMLGSVKG